MSWLRPGALALGVLVTAAGSVSAADVPSAAAPWPTATAESRPWTRWWWLGSAVDERNLTRELELFRAAGLGGVEICPIYGVEGWDDRNVPFLSPHFMQLFQHTLAEAKRLGLGVDFTTGTGWPFGGPWVTDADASSRLAVAELPAQDGALGEPLPQGTPRYVLAVSESGERVELTSRVSGGRLDWSAPGRWRVFVAVSQGPIQKVKRAAPGGEGNVVDPFSVDSLGRYLARFDEAFASSGVNAPRAHFHDSYEYYGASYTPRVFEAFAARRGYDLRSRIEALAGRGDADTVARVKSDYSATLAELHLDYVRRWTEWAHQRGSLSRNQAHGAPGNLLDLYSAADIPETEVFRKMDEAMMPRLKFASSAAHLKGTTLASAEAFTWLGEHFSTPLSLVKRAADWLYLSGVNHLLLHGIPYSPAGEPWPGFQFYASVNFGPEGGLWRDLPALTAYLARVQSILQAGEPDADILLYYSPEEAWYSRETVRHDELAIPNPVPPSYDAWGLALWSRGYSWDAVSDRWLAEARVDSGEIRLGAGRYRALVVPPTRLVSVEAARDLARLARQGASLVFIRGLPADVPGYGSLEARRRELEQALADMSSSASGRVLQGDDPEPLLAGLGVRREAMTDAGLQLVRRRTASGRDYFVVNRGQATFDGWAPLAKPARSALLLDPLAEASWGAASVRTDSDGRASVRLQLEPGASMVVRTSDEPPASGAWSYAEPSGPAMAIAGSWTVAFLEGGPRLPRPFETRTLASWASRQDPEAQRFAGTARYTLRFERPSLSAPDWLLDLGDVRESARVSLNGQSLGTLWTRPFRLRLGPALRPGANRLEVEVTNLAANRVRDLDRRGVAWKKFKDIGVVNVDYEPFDASGWPLADSGLLGPVTLTPLRAEPAGAAPPTGSSR